MHRTEGEGPVKWFLRLLRGQSFTDGLPNPWLDEAPVCPRCVQHEQVHLWHPPAQWICVGCFLIFNRASLRAAG